LDEYFQNPAADHIETLCRIGTVGLT